MVRACMHASVRVRACVIVRACVRACVSMSLPVRPWVRVRSGGHVHAHLHLPF